MSLSITLNEEQSQRLGEIAGRFGIEVTEVVRQSIDAYLDRQRAFDAAAKLVLDKNADLYHRLAQ